MKYTINISSWQSGPAQPGKNHTKLDHLEETLSQLNLTANLIRLTYFKHKLVRRDKEGDFLLIKGETQQEEIAIVNLYVPNVKSPNFIQHRILNLNTKIHPNTLVVRDFSTHLSPKNRSFGQKIKKLELNDTIDLMDLMDNFRVFHPTTP
jgi:hypothetical protein